jgi:hypothetical protein
MMAIVYALAIIGGAVVLAALGLLGYLMAYDSGSTHDDTCPCDRCLDSV